MNLNFSPVTDDSIRTAQLLLYTAATPLQIIQGIAAGALDLSPYVKQIKQRPAQLDFTLSWHSELNGLVPVPGNLVLVNLGSQLLWTGIVTEVSNYQLNRGTRELALTARTRDGSALWRTTPRVSDIYPAGTQLTYIAQQLCSAIGLQGAEIALPAVSAYTVHDNVQMANLSIWDMLTALYQAVGYQPYVDGYGRIKCISRDTQRTADISLSNERTVAIKGSYSKRQKTSARVKWLDPNLSQVIQPAQSLTNASLTAGFFQPTVTKDITFSTDGTQQAINTYLVIKQSCNSGLLPVATESYEQLTPTTGRITLTNTYFSAAFIVAALAAIVEASSIPDTVVVDVALVGETISVGRLIEGSALFAAMLVMSSIGTGSYEVWGQPSSWVHQTNTTEAYDITAPAWQEAIVEIDNDFVMNEAMSEAFATRELLYEVQSAINYEAQIVDDPRIEAGDILQLPDGSQLYVLDYERDLTRGAAAVLDVTGFQCGAVGSAVANVQAARNPAMGSVTTAQGQFAGLQPPVVTAGTSAQGQSIGGYESGGGGGGSGGTFGVDVGAGKLINSSDGSTIDWWGTNISGLETGNNLRNRWSIFDLPGSFFTAYSAAYSAPGRKIGIFRFPLNVDSALGLTDPSTAAPYQAGMLKLAKSVTGGNFVCDYDLHWDQPKSPGGAYQYPVGQPCFPSRDNAIAFWQMAAALLKGIRGVTFELMNEPFGHNNYNLWVGSGSGGADAFLMRDGGTIAPFLMQRNSDGAVIQINGGASVAVAGMQDMVNAIRAINTTTVILSAPIGWAGEIETWLASKPTDPSGRLVCSWHLYGYNKGTGPPDAVLAANDGIVISETYGLGALGGYSWAQSHHVPVVFWGLNNWGGKNVTDLQSELMATPPWIDSVHP